MLNMSASELAIQAHQTSLAIKLFSRRNQIAKQSSQLISTSGFDAESGRVITSQGSMPAIGEPSQFASLGRTQFANGSALAIWR